MIGVDTNILVRAVLEDDIKEANIAKQFLKRTANDKKLFISSYAILEMVWVLKVKKCPREQICDILFTLLDSPGVVVGERDTVIAAVEKYTKGKADFGDYLILAEGENNGAPKLATFDQDLSRNNHECLHPSNYL